MTDFRTLPAGPELDAIVAERVLGWTGIPPEDRTIINFPARAWSQVTSSAWEIVEAMERRGWEWILTKESGRYSASFQAPERNLWPDDEWAESVPLAICRAALAALEVGNDT